METITREFPASDARKVLACVREGGDLISINMRKDKWGRFIVVTCHKAKCEETSTKPQWHLTAMPSSASFLAASFLAGKDLAFAWADTGEIFFLWRLADTGTEWTSYHYAPIVGDHRVELPGGDTLLLTKVRPTR